MSKFTNFIILNVFSDNFLLLLSVGSIIGVTDMYDDDLLKQSAQ